MIGFMRFGLAALMVVAGLMTGCATDDSARTLKIQVPASTVPPEYAAYLGKWVGKWDNKWPVEFTVWRVSDNGEGSLRYMWKERVGGPWSKRDRTYKIEEGKLVSTVITIEIDAENSNTTKAIGRFSKRTRTAALTKIEGLGF